jgi:beta-galactosidase/beta-glucuronidase
MRLRFVAAIALAALAAAQDIPRSEYPQPQFQRQLWLSLNGRWLFDYDDANTGIAQNWATNQRKWSKAITVPYAPETKLGGIGDTGFHPVVWYRRSVTAPANWKGKRVLLHFGAVDYRAMVWVNGQMAGMHEGGHVPFRFDVTELLKSGANIITVRAEDPPTDRTIPRGKQYWEPKSRGIFYTRTTGIWQPVWLEATGDTYLRSVRITPSNNGLVRFAAQIERFQPGTEFHATIRSENRVIASGMTAAQSNKTPLAVAVTNPRLWNVGQPNLYDVTFELRRNGAALDTVQSYFGFREVAVEGSRVTINGRPVYLKMVLDQGYWPESTITPPSDEAIEFDIKAAQQMGFNGARKHQKVEDPRFLYWADRLGYLVSGEIANAYEFDTDYANRFTREWIEAVERDYNHPSIVMWVPINESWGAPNLREPQQQWHLKSNYWLTKSIDPTRPVIDNDGWEHVDATDLFAIHDYARDGKLLHEKYKDLGKPGAKIPDVSRRTLVPGYQYNGTPILLSEFGGIAYAAPGSNVPPDAWGYAGVEKTPQAALERLRSLYEAIAKIPAFVGVCYTQLTDVEQEINGLLTYDRKMKFEAKDVKAINDLLR